ncbi:MAG TPA: LytR C-terminal domain-containing protein [Acidimicrobiales bacterium]|nr:LytR C-terminal domain-containing protein [Acidimicrobiales bacterium]
MRRGQHAADDGSFGKSAGGAMARGIALIVAAVLLGVVLLRATDGDEPFTPVADDDETEVISGDEDDDTDTSVDVPTTDTTLAPPRNPAEVTVLVANGAGIGGLASRIAETLNGANYITAEPTNTRAPADESVVFYTPGYEADAAAVAALLTPTPRTEALPDPPPVESIGTANVIVVAAADLAEPG